MKPAAKARRAAANRTQRYPAGEKHFVTWLVNFEYSIL